MLFGDPTGSKAVLPWSVGAYSDAWRAARSTARPSSWAGVLQRAGKGMVHLGLEYFTQELCSCKLPVLGTKKASLREKKTSSCLEQDLGRGIVCMQRTAPALRVLPQRRCGAKGGREGRKHSFRQFGKDSEEKTRVREVGGERRSSPGVPIGIRGRDDCVGSLPCRQEESKAALGGEKSW